jgi:general stress protein 26
MHEFESLKDLLNNSRYAVYATVNEDGSPHNSPLFFIPSDDLKKLYIGTHPDSLHARNFERNGRAFAVIFGQTNEGGKGLYFKLEGMHLTKNKEELEEALNANNQVRAKFGKEPLAIDYYQAPSQQRMYVGDIVEITSNSVERDSQGKLVRDTRSTVDISELL